MEELQFTTRGDEPLEDLDSARAVAGAAVCVGLLVTAVVGAVKAVIRLRQGRPGSALAYLAVPAYGTGYSQRLITSIHQAATVNISQLF